MKKKAKRFKSPARKSEKMGHGSLVAPDLFKLDLRRRRDGKWNCTYTERFLDTPANRALVANTKTAFKSIPNLGFERRIGPLSFRFRWTGITLEKASNFIMGEFMSWSTLSKLTMGHLYEAVARGGLVAMQQAKASE